MIRFQLFTAVLIGCAVGMLGSMEATRDSSLSGVTVGFDVSVSKAYAGRAHARRTSRRVARRTTRRVVRRNTLPAGCVWRAPYHYCGGVYYQPVVEAGKTVYVVVYP